MALAVQSKTMALDASGSGFVDVTGVSAGNIMGIAVQGPDPVAQGFLPLPGTAPNGGLLWTVATVGANARFAIHGARPGTVAPINVWLGP